MCNNRLSTFSTFFLFSSDQKDTLKIQVIFEYDFRRVTNAAETACNINAEFGEGSADRTMRFWFKRFRDGNFYLKNEPRGRPPTQVNNNEL